MTDRVFDECAIPYGDKSTKAMKIVCAGCAAVGYHPHQTGHSRKPPTAAAQFFRNKGWSVGNHPAKDFCAECVKRGKPKKEKVMKEMASAPAAEPPRAMTREERRIINDKLDEVYGTGGYKSPWTDSAVAKDLGVPRDWVSTTREAFFGPAGSNPLFDDFLAEKQKLDRNIAGLDIRYQEAVKATEAFKAEYASLCDGMRALQVLGRKIEREIGK